MKSFLVIGLGRFGSALAQELYTLGHEVLVVDEDEDAVQRISDKVTHAVVGNCTDEAVLRSLGVRNFDCAIVAIASKIQDSILITVLLKELGVKYVIAKAQSRIHSKVLQRIGADKVVFPEHDMGTRLAQTIVSANVIDFIELSEEYSIAELTTPASWVGRSLSELGIRAKFGVNVLAIRGENREDINVTPSPDQLLKAEDILIIVGSNDDINHLSKLQ